MIMHKQFINIPSITFFFPYKDVGGVSVLFLRLSEYIAETYGIQTYIIDYPDGYMSRNVQNKHLINSIHLDEGAITKVPEDTILVMQAGFPFNINAGLSVNAKTKTIFWILYPFNLVPLYVKPLLDLQCRNACLHKFAINTLMFSLKRKIRNLINSMTIKKSLLFMDETTLKITSDRLGVIIDDPIFVPVPCDDVVSAEKPVLKRKNNDNLIFCWIGRLADFKTNILIYTITKLSEIATRKKTQIIMYVIGDDGPDAKIIRELNLNNRWFKKVDLGEMTRQSLKIFLKENVDVVTAMGTSALESAQLGIPTILLDFSYGPVCGDYKFKWLFESTGCSLGEAINADHYEKNNKTLDNAIEALSNNYSQISKKCLEYYIKNHSMAHVCNRFLNALDNATFQYEDFDPDFLKKGCVMKSYELLKNIYYSLRRFAC